MVSIIGLTLRLLLLTRFSFPRLLAQVVSSP